MKLDQKRSYDLVRRRRLRSIRHLYGALPQLDGHRCFYCGKEQADTLDHCPSVLCVASLGVEFFLEKDIPFLLIPACGTCNTGMGTSHVFLRGRLARIHISRVVRIGVHDREHRIEVVKGAKARKLPNVNKHVSRYQTSNSIERGR